MTSTTQNETTTIQATVEASLHSAGYGTYVTYARPVVEALTAREQAISERLLDIGTGMGADIEDVRDALSNVGLALAPEPESDDDDDDDPSIRSMLRGITQQLDSLTAFAKRHGFNG